LVKNDISIHKKKAEEIGNIPYSGHFGSLKIFNIDINKKRKVMSLLRGSASLKSTFHIWKMNCGLDLT
jgi:hypothetical protein